MAGGLLLLAKAGEATGNRTAALDAYRRIEREQVPAREQGAVLLGAARLLPADGKWDEARGRLERALNESDLAIVGEAAYRLGGGVPAAGENDERGGAQQTAP